MIRFIRGISIWLCVVSLLLYAGVSVYVWQHTDKNGPNILMSEEEITISTQDDESAVFSGISVQDRKDGNVTDSLVIESMSNFVEEGCREVTIAASDGDGNVAKVSRKVRYSDYVSPRIKLTGPLRVAVNNSSELMNVIRAEDCLDGDLTAAVQITSEKAVSSTTPGEYTMHIQVSNSAGDVTDLPVTVEYYDYALESHSINILLNEYLVYTKVGQALDPYAYLKGIKVYGIEYDWDSDTPPQFGRESVFVENPVDYQTPGTYEILYSVQNEEGAQGRVRLIVVVEE